MQTIFYSPDKSLRDQIYRNRINHTVYSNSEFDLNYQPLDNNLDILHTHNLIIVADDYDWVENLIDAFNQYNLTYRLINYSNDAFKESKNTVTFTATVDLISLVYYEQFVKPTVYLGASHQDQRILFNNIKKTNYTFISAKGCGYTDLSLVPMWKKITNRFVQITLSLMLPCNNPATFLADSTTQLCLLANPSSVNPLNKLYDLQEQKWIVPNFNNNQLMTLPLLRLNADQVNREFKTGKYTLYAVKVDEL